MNVNLPLWSRLPTASVIACFTIIHHRIRLPPVMAMRFGVDLGEAKKTNKTTPQTPGIYIGLKNDDRSAWVDL